MKRLQSIVPCILTGIGGVLAGYFGAISQPRATDAASDVQRDTSTQRGDAFPTGADPAAPQVRGPRNVPKAGSPWP